MHVHGLGAALAPAVAFVATLVRDSAGTLQVSATTSTEVLIDQPNEMDDDITGAVRHNSAVHMAIRRTLPAPEPGPGATTSKQSV